MKVTCHPRLGGASQREAGVTGIKPSVFLNIYYRFELLDCKYICSFRLGRSLENSVFYLE